MHTTTFLPDLSEPGAFQAGVKRIDGGIVTGFGKRAVAFLEDGSVFFPNMPETLELVPDGKGQLLWHLPILKGKLGMHRFDELAVCVDEDTENFAETMLSVLPMLEQFMKGIDNWSKVKFLIPSRSVAREALRLLGVNEGSQMVFFDPSVVYVANTLIVSSPVGLQHPPAPVLDAVRSRMLTTLYGTRFPPVEHVVVLQRSSNRQFSNLDELVRALEAKLSLPVRVYADAELRKLPLLNQIDFFQKCAAIISATGGGVLNALWMRSGSTVVEVYPDVPQADSPLGNYRKFSEALGHSYAGLLVHSSNEFAPLVAPVEDVVKSVAARK